MVCLFFGLPGAGKTTLIAKIAFEAVSAKGRKRKYKNVYSNVDLAIPGVIRIDNECIGKYNLEDGLILIDEASIFADNRDYKNFSKALLEFFMMHRHYNVDCFLFTQTYNGVDKKIRSICDRVYYIYKGKILGYLWSSYYRIPYGIIIPDPKKDSASNKLGEIVEGYCKPSLFQRIFSHKIFRYKYYKYFNSWERKLLPPLPEQYKPYQPTTKKVFLLGKWRDKVS